MFLGSACSILIGGSLPIFNYLEGKMFDNFTDIDEMVKQAESIFIAYSIFGAIAVFVGWGMQYFWTIAGTRQANACRKAYISALMKQEVGWFETQESSELVSRFVADTLAFHLGIGEKVGMLLYLVTVFTSGVIISFVQGWELTLAILTVLPLVTYSWHLSEGIT